MVNILYTTYKNGDLGMVYDFFTHIIFHILSILLLRILRMQLYPAQAVENCRTVHPVGYLALPLWHIVTNPRRGGLPIHCMFEATGIQYRCFHYRALHLSFDVWDAKKG